MIHMTFLAPDRASLLREVKAYLAAEEAQLEGASAPAVERASSLSFIRSILERIPPRRIARDVLRDWATATVDGRVAHFKDLVVQHAGGDGRRWAGFIQSITKASQACGRPVAEWDPVRHGWRMKESDARAVLELLGAE